MHIFIDESGGFARSATRPHSISCVGAAIIPGRNLDRIERQFHKLARGWPLAKCDEVKGKLLSEVHISELCDLLSQFEVLFEASVMDMSLCDDSDIDLHKKNQAEGMTNALTKDHHPTVVDALWEFRRTLEQMPSQLYAQACAMTDVVWKALQHGQLYFCQRFPGELAQFRWVIDAKNKNRITNYEEWWKTNVMPLVQSRSEREPLTHLQGGDYSAFQRKFPYVPIPEHLQPTAPSGCSSRAINVSAIFGRAMEFATSETYLGLQIADVLTNALRRGLSGRLQKEGWEPLKKLMIQTHLQQFGN